MLPQHLSIDLVGARVHSQDQVKLGPEALGNAQKPLMELGPELGSPPWVWFHQTLQAGSHSRFQGQSLADMTQLNVLHQLLPAILEGTAIDIVMDCRWVS